MTRDLNCDLGEGESARKTAALLDCVTSANIACGGHAGDFATMRRTVRLALERGVHIGAHPGLANRATFGRDPLDLTSRAFELLLLHQISALESVLKIEGQASRGARLHHIKLHGALYHMVEESQTLRKTYLGTVAEIWPHAIIFARADGSVARDAKHFRLRVWPEGFLDRAYQSDGNLVPRSASEALLNPQEFKRRLRCLATSQRFPSAVNTPLQIRARTWCIHSDSPHAQAFARLARKFLLLP